MILILAPDKIVFGAGTTTTGVEEDISTGVLQSVYFINEFFGNSVFN